MRAEEHAPGFDVHIADGQGGAYFVWTKGFEVVLMGLGTVALWASPVGWAPLVVLAGMGLQSALFAPGKYGIVPELVGHERLATANGQLEGASFVAIVLGSAAGGVLLEARGWIGVPTWAIGLLLTVLAVGGFAAALTIPRTAPAAAGREPFAQVLGGAFRALRGDRALWLATLGSIAFWGLASLLGQDVLVYGKQVLGFCGRLVPRKHPEYVQWMLTEPGFDTRRVLIAGRGFSPYARDLLALTGNQT